MGYSFFRHAPGASRVFFDSPAKNCPNTNRAVYPLGFARIDTILKTGFFIDLYKSRQA